MFLRRCEKGQCSEDEDDPVGDEWGDKVSDEVDDKGAPPPLKVLQCYNH